MSSHDFQFSCQQLIENGYAVIPVLHDTSIIQQKILQQVETMPEYNNPDCIRVMGSFGALGNPCSFHIQAVRELRFLLFDHARQLFMHYSTDEITFQQLFDRLSIRQKGTCVNAEGWHRDQVPNQVKLPLKTNDFGQLEKKPTPVNAGDVFGGWINLDVTETQFFTCAPGTHVNRNSKDGFQQIDKKDWPSLEKKSKRIPIPPGHWIIFYQNIAHKITRTKLETDSIRLYCGWNVVSTYKHFYNRKYIKRVCRQQEAPLLPSGQRPPLYASNHISFWRERLIDWSHNFKDEFIQKRTTSPNSKTPNIKYKVVYRFITRLPVEMRQKSYTRQEIKIMMPTTINATK